MTLELRNGVLVIAEVGNNHEGDFGRAREMVVQAAEAGVDAVKFQVFRVAEFANPQDEARRQQLERFEFGLDQFAELAELAHASGLAFVATPLDLTSAEFLAETADVIKVASGDLDFVPLVERVAASAKPLVLSTGVSDDERVAAGLATVESVRGAPARDLAVLHCVSAYPAPLDGINLSSIPYLRDRFGYPVGWSDHVLGVDAALAAVTLGACIVEKHFTLEGIESDFRDHALSSTPGEMRALVEGVRARCAMLGTSGKRIEPAEEPNAVAIRRSIATAADLDAGHVVAADDLTWLRPGGGIAPGREHDVVGRRLKHSLRAGDLLRPEDLE